MSQFKIKIKTLIIIYSTKLIRLPIIVYAGFLSQVSSFKVAAEGCLSKYK